MFDDTAGNHLIQKQLNTKWTELNWTDTNTK